MAPKFGTRLVDQPPSASSSDEDDEVSDPEEETQNSEGESDDEEEQTPQKTPEPAPRKSQEQVIPKPTVQKPQSSSDSESDSDSDDDGSDSSQPPRPSPSPSASDFTIKTKSVSDFALKPCLTSNSSSASKPTAKRAAAATPKESARKKSKSGEEDGNAEEKKSSSTASAFGRIWSEEDEIAILNGTIEFKSQKGIDPFADMPAFHEFIKDKLRAGFSKNQIYEKIRRLRGKFRKIIQKGGNPDFSKPHDYNTYNLLTKIWGGETSNGVNENLKSPNPNGKAKKMAEIKKISEPKKVAKLSNLSGVSKEEEKEKKIVTKENDTSISRKEDDFNSKYPRLVESFNKGNMPKVSQEALVMMKEKLSLIGSSKAKELEEKWTKLLNEEAELYLKMTDLVREQIKLIMDEVKR